MDRSLDTLVGLLGILKAGAAYVPFDTSYPAERLAYLVKDSQVQVVLTHRSAPQESLGGTEQRIWLDADWDRIEQERGDDPVSWSGPDSVAYVIYTSGSTGQPKGVLGLHRGAINRFRWMWDKYPFDSGDVCCQKTSLGFADSIWEIFGPILQGLPTVVIKDSAAKDPAALVSAMETHGVSRLVLVPSLLSGMLDGNSDLDRQLSRIKMVVSSGEALSSDLCARFHKEMPGRLLVNLYGLSEVSADVTWYEARGLDRCKGVAIGEPMSNTETYLVNGAQELTPIGLPGELVVAGEHLSRGYHNRPELTAEKFIPNPFSERTGSRLFRTGDIARYQGNGRIEYVGRADSQVKIRGYRIEMGEIQAALQDHSEIKQAVVVARQNTAGSDYLAAYIVSEGRAMLTPDELRRFLGARLPEFMVPSTFVFLAEFPLTTSGKVDRGKLPAPDQAAPDAAEASSAAASAIEEVLAGIWATVLKVDSVRREANFFDLGGHSLLATELMSRIRRTFHVELSLRTLFQSPTVAALARIIEESLATDTGLLAPPVLPVPRDGELPLSFSQQRLWFLDQLTPGGTAYNISTRLRLKGRLQASLLEQSLNEVVRRHEILRTSFHESEGGPAQAISAAAHLTVTLIDLSALSEADRDAEAGRLALLEANRPFELSKGPLLRTTLVRFSEEYHLVLFTMHHIISDGWSMSQLVREIGVLDSAFSQGEPSPLAELQIQFADFAHWQRAWLSGEVLESQLSYWRRQLGNMPSLDLPTDYARPVSQPFRGRTMPLSLPAKLTFELKALSRRQEVTLFMTLLAGFQALMNKYTGQDDVVVGSDIANRNRDEIENLIGFFVNTLVFRTDLSGDPTFRELLQRVREVCLSAYAHQDLPFEKVVEELRPDRDPSRQSLFQVWFEFGNFPTEKLSLSGVTLGAMPIEQRSAKFDLLVALSENGDTIDGSIEYNIDLFKDSTIEQLARRFTALLENAAADPDQMLSDLSMITKDERDELTMSFRSRFDS